MKTTETVPIPSPYAKKGAAEVTELVIKAELDRNDEIVFLIYGSKNNMTQKTLLYQTRKLQEVMDKFDELMSTLLDGQILALKQLAASRE